MNHKTAIEHTLTERREQILRIVIQEYSQSVQPVSSKNIAEKYKLGVSAATIRNDLAALEQDGLLTHPHTSAGRIPTDAGYRYFVQHLMMDDKLPLGERQKIRSRFGLARRELDQWLRVSTSVLADTTQSAALATAPQSSSNRFKHIELVGISDTRVLLVLVLQTGTVRQQLLDLDEPAEQSILSYISNELNDRLRDKDADSIWMEATTLSPLVSDMAQLVAEIISQADAQSMRQLYRDGLSQMLEAPEFSDSDSVRAIVQLLEERQMLEQVVDEYNPIGDVKVIIAGDGRYSELQEISLVLSRYGTLDQATGYLGVVGPLRMSYGRTIGAVRFVAMLMSDMVEEMHGR